MSKKFIKTEGNKVTLIHYMPFDSVEGLHKTEDDLCKEGYLIDNVPEPEQVLGKTAVPYYTPERGYYYEYIATPQQLTTTATIEQNIQLIKSVQDGVITPEQFRRITGVEYSFVFNDL